jgi:hypothetical protein
VAENLLEARLHQERLAERAGDGISFPTKTTVKSRIREGAEMDMEIAGWARALCSSLDCLAACAIGILRIPLSIQRAQLSNLNSIPDLKKKATPAQQSAWQELFDLLDLNRRKPPDHWFDWFNGMRVLTVHRARQVRLLLQRTKKPDAPQLAVVAEDPMAELKASARFDLHLRQRPGLPDLQDLATVKKVEDLWIGESAQTTLPGVFQATNELIEGVAEFLLHQWEAIEGHVDDFPPPIKKWELDRAAPPEFAGITQMKSGYRPDLGQGHGHPSLGKRLELAEKLALSEGLRRPPLPR